eukprot:2318976-Pleurochrysis_carterae.AAC.2
MQTCCAALTNVGRRQAAWLSTPPPAPPLPASGQNFAPLPPTPPLSLRCRVAQLRSRCPESRQPPRAWAPPALASTLSSEPQPLPQATRAPAAALGAPRRLPSSSCFPESPRSPAQARRISLPLAPPDRDTAVAALPLPLVSLSPHPRRAHQYADQIQSAVHRGSISRPPATRAAHLLGDWSRPRILQPASHVASREPAHYWLRESAPLPVCARVRVRVCL